MTVVMFPRMISLIRSEGKEFTDGPSLTPQEFLQLPELRRSSKTQRTRAVEDALGLGDCLYFFAGHACPDFGDVVLLYDDEIADKDEGGATPFDTGGLHSNLVHHSSKSDAKAYYRDHAVPLSGWREAIRPYLKSYFESPAAYVTGSPPIHDDPSHRLRHPQNSRRAWTWEIRLHRDHPVEQGLRRAWMSAEYFEIVREGLSRGLASERCATLLLSGKIRGVSADESPHHLAEKEAATWA
jgi:hypothetical protein